MRLSDDRYESDRRKYTLALSMIEHGARVCTVTQWTGLSKYRVQTLTHSYESTTRARRKRGESPSQPAYFLKSMSLARESMALAYIALQMQVIPPAVMPDARGSLPGLLRGERLMSAFELYRALLPDGLISLEYAILFITELAERRALALARCRACHDVMLIDRLGRRQELGGEENEFRTEADVLNVSDKEFWFSAYIRHTDLEILSEQQHIDDLVHHFGFERQAASLY